MRAATEDGPHHVVLDLSNVAFVDSSGLGAIVASMKQLGNGRRLDLAGLSPDVGKVFRLTRMNSVFVIHDDVETALPPRRLLTRDRWPDIPIVSAQLHPQADHSRLPPSGA